MTFFFDEHKFFNVIRNLTNQINDIREFGLNYTRVLKRDNNYSDEMIEYIKKIANTNQNRIEERIKPVLYSQLKNNNNYDIVNNFINSKYNVPDITGIYDLVKYIFEESILLDPINDIKDDIKDDTNILDKLEFLSITSSSSCEEDYVRSYTTKEQLQEEYNFYSQEDNYFPEYDDFTGLKRNQKDAIELSEAYRRHIDGTDITLPLTCIHCQATGAGKTIIALAIIWFYIKLNNYNPDMTILWFTERKSIMMDLFFKKLETKQNDNKNIAEQYECNKENFDKWRYHNVINMGAFEIMEFVKNKDKNWYDKINQETTKPKFVIINRTYLTLNSTYKKIKHNKPCIIIHDECHSAVSTQTRDFLVYAKSHWNASIMGFSATPLRTGKTLNIKNTDRLTELFKNEETGNLNILTNYNINSAIANKIILKPKFSWFKLTNKHKDKIGDDDFKVIMNLLNDIIVTLPYGKIIAWCGNIKLCDRWYKKFNENKDKYPNLKNIKLFKDHSKTNDDDYSNFYDLYIDKKKKEELKQKYLNKQFKTKDEQIKAIEKYNIEYEQHVKQLIDKKSEGGILFAAKKFREGSDITCLDACIFLDKTKDRSALVFIQSIGRVLRFDKYGKKQYGLIMDGYIDNDNHVSEIDFIQKIIRYYLEFENMSLNSVDATNKILEYNKIMNTIDFSKSRETKIVKMKIGSEIIEIECDSIDWDNFGKYFDDVIQTKLKFEDYHKFQLLKSKAKQNNFKSKNEYLDQHKIYNFPINPEELYSKYWKGWIDFLDIDVSKYYQHLSDFKRACKQLSITNEASYKQNYNKDNRLPSYGLLSDVFFKDKFQIDNLHNYFNAIPSDKSF